MTKCVLLLGRTAAVLEDAERQIELGGFELLARTGIDGVRGAFAERHIDHVIMGAGLDLAVRLEIVREVFERSDTTTVHMKDRNSGPEGLLPFVRAILTGLKDWEA